MAAPRTGPGRLLRNACSCESRMEVGRAALWGQTMRVFCIGLVDAFSRPALA
jgi:hypothetical protein